MEAACFLCSNVSYVFSHLSFSNTPFFLFVSWPSPSEASPA